MSLIQKLQGDFCHIILPEIAKDVVGIVDVKKQEKIDNKKFYDVRIPRMIYFSGKGDSHYPEYRNVTLLSHSTEVGFKAANFCIIDNKNFLDEDSIGRLASVAIVVGLLHDVNKMEQDSGKVVSKSTKYFFDLYKCLDFLQIYGVNDISGDDIQILVENVENRTTGQSSIIPKHLKEYITIVSKYIKISDGIDSRFLKGNIESGIKSALKYMNDSFKYFNNHDDFDVDLFEYFDVTYPNINIGLLQEIANSCEDISGHRPLIHTYSDGYFVSLLPKKYKQDILKVAKTNLIDNLFSDMDVSIYLNPQKNITISGKKISFKELKNLIIKNDKNSDIMSFKVTSRNNIQLWNKALDMIKETGLSGSNDLSSDKIIGKIGKLFDFSSEIDYSNYCELLQIYTILNMKESNNKYSAKKRMDTIFELLSKEQKDTWHEIENLSKSKDDGLLMSALFSIFIYLNAKKDISFHTKIFGENELFNNWLPLENEGIMRGCVDNISSMQNALENYLSMKINGALSKKIKESGKYCYFTGEPIEEGQKPVTKSDNLVGVKTSAFSNREGTPEHKEKEVAEIFVSPLMKLEIQSRENTLRSKRFSEDKPMTITSPLSFGMGNYIINTNEVIDFNISEILTEDVTKSYVTTEFMMENTCTIGRRQVMEKKLADQISTIRKIMISAHRLGRPIHVYAGIPFPSNAYVFFDCLPPLVKNFMGTNEWRLDQLSRAIQDISLLEDIATYQRDILHKLNHNNNYDIFCYLYKEFSKEKKISQKTQIYLLTCIEEEEKKMSNHPIIKLAKIAARIQMRNNHNTTDTVDEIILRTSFDLLSSMTADERNDSDFAISIIAGNLMKDLKRRDNNNKFFARSSVRENKSIEHYIEEFAKCFINEFYFTFCKGKLLDQSRKKIMIDSYCFTKNKESKRLNIEFPKIEK